MGWRNKAPLIPIIKDNGNDSYELASSIANASDVSPPYPPYLDGIKAASGVILSISDKDWEDIPLDKVLLFVSISLLNILASLVLYRFKKDSKSVIIINVYNIRL